MNSKNILGVNPRKPVVFSSPNPTIECTILQKTGWSHQIGGKTLIEVATLLQYLICRHKGQKSYQNKAFSNAWWMLAYPMYWLDKYCLKKWEEDKTTTFSIESLAPIIHEAWSAIYNHRIEEESKNNTGLNAKAPFTPNRTNDSKKTYSELSSEAKEFNKLYVYMYFLLLEEYAKNAYPETQFSFFEN